MLVAVVVLRLWLTRLREVRSAIVHRILDRVEGEVVHGRLLSDTVRGRHDGRAFRMRLGTRASYRLFSRSIDRGWRFLYPLQLEVELPCAPPIELRVRRVYPVPRMNRDEDLYAPESFLNRHVVQGASDFDPLQASREARISLSNLLGRCGLDEVLLKEGTLQVRGNLRRVGPQELNAILGELEILAREFDRRPALQVGVAERYVWIGSEDRRARCAYCHDDLGNDDLVSCGRCHTLTHTDCYGEHGSCPILGCGGHQAMSVPNPAKADAGGVDEDFGGDLGWAPPADPAAAPAIHVAPVSPLPVPQHALEGASAAEEPRTFLPVSPVGPLEVPPDVLPVDTAAQPPDPTRAPLAPLAQDHPLAATDGFLRVSPSGPLEVPLDLVSPDAHEVDELAIPPDEDSEPVGDRFLPVSPAGPLEVPPGLVPAVDPSASQFSPPPADELAALQELDVPADLLDPPEGTPPTRDQAPPLR